MLHVAEIVFWTSLFIIFYTYAGYPLLLTLLVKIKRSGWISTSYRNATPVLPPITLIIPAYNERKVIRQKILNTLEIDYPQEKFNVILITDGSEDGSNEIAKEFSSVKLLHEPQRRGKIAAMNRAVTFAETEIVVFSDANTLLNPESIRKIAAHYDDPDTGGVAGEKKIFNEEGIAAGEGMYWKYESYLKKKDAELNSVVGAAGELFSLRLSLYTPLSENIILDDFVQSLLVCQKGYRVLYEPGAFATEHASLSLSDEKERKVRISAGGFQAMVKLRHLLNPFRYGTLCFQYVSHRVLRWTLCPLSLILALISCLYLSFSGAGFVYQAFLITQAAFYLAAIAGAILPGRLLYLPFYFCFMNFCVVAGFIRYISGKQTSTWQTAERTDLKK